MATTHSAFDLHDHSGAKWLASAGVWFAVAIITAFMMLVYPHI